MYLLPISKTTSFSARVNLNNVSARDIGSKYKEIQHISKSEGLDISITKDESINFSSFCNMYYVVTKKDTEIKRPTYGLGVAVTEKTSDSKKTASKIYEALIFSIEQLNKKITNKTGNKINFSCLVR